MHVQQGTSSNRLSISSKPVNCTGMIFMLNLNNKLMRMKTKSVYFPRNCVSRYTSSTNTARHTLDHSVNDPPAKKFRRSQTSFTFSLSACIVEIYVICLRIQNTQTGGEQPSVVDQPCRSKTRHPTMNTSWRSVTAARMFGRMRYAAEWSAQYQTYSLPKRDIIGTVCVDSLPKGCLQRHKKANPRLQTVTINQIWH